MKFTFTCKKVSLNDSIKEYAEKKISKLDRYFREDANALVTFSVEKGHRCVVEITIRSGSTLFRAQEDSRDGDMRGAIDAACSTIDRQIRKNKTRLSKRLRQEALAPAVPAEFDVSEETEFQVVRTKHVAVKPMSEDEAILQMNLLDHDFFVYRNTDDVISIVYHRKNGGYGLKPTKAPIDNRACLLYHTLWKLSNIPPAWAAVSDSGSFLFRRRSPVKPHKPAPKFLSARQKILQGFPLQSVPKSAIINPTK